MKSENKIKLSILVLLYVVTLFVLRSIVEYYAPEAAMLSSILVAGVCAGLFYLLQRKIPLNFFVIISLIYLGGLVFLSRAVKPDRKAVQSQQQSPNANPLVGNWIAVEEEISMKASIGRDTIRLSYHPENISNDYTYQIKGDTIILTGVDLEDHLVWIYSLSDNSEVLNITSEQSAFRFKKLE